MSPDTRVRPFMPALLPTVPTQGRGSGSAAAGVDARARAAGYAAGWTAGARAAAAAGAEQQRRLAEEHERAEAERDAAVGDALGLLGRAVAAASGRTVPVLDDARRAVYQAALDLAAAVLQRELAPGPGSARALLERALALPVEVGVHTVRMHPRDLAEVQALLATGSARLPVGVALTADALLAPGDAVSVHPAGLLDARIATALDRAREILLEDLR